MFENILIVIILIMPTSNAYDVSIIKWKKLY